MNTEHKLDAIIDCGTRLFPSDTDAWRAHFPAIAAQLDSLSLDSSSSVQLGFKPSKLSAYGYLAADAIGIYIRLDYIWSEKHVSIPNLTATEHERLRWDLTGIALRHGRGLLSCGLMAVVSIEDHLPLTPFTLLAKQLQVLERRLLQLARSAEIERARLFATVQSSAQPQRVLCGAGRIGLNSNKKAEPTPPSVIP